MSRTHWWLIGAITVAVAIVLYLVLFCPTECH